MTMNEMVEEKIIKYIQLPVVFDAKKMKDEIDALEETYWKMHYQKTQFEGDWSVLALRAIMGSADMIYAMPVSSHHEYKDTELLDQCPYIQQVLDYLQCEKTVVRLMKLNAGSVIKKHKDLEMNFESGEARIHIPVRTNDHVEFYIEDERIIMKEGECWYLNLNLEHNVNNSGTTDRIHLVVDCLVNDWVKETFAGPAYNKKEIAVSINKYAVSEKTQIVEMLRQMNTEVSNRMADEMEKEND